LSDISISFARNDPAVSLGFCGELPYIDGAGGTMKPLYILVFTSLLSLAAGAQTPLAPLAASEVVLADLLYVKRPVVVFADSPADPNFIRQMELLAQDPDGLEDRDVVVITDTDPAALSDVRRRLRPRGFSLVIMDKDGKTTLRKPLPWAVREIGNAIDKFPTAIIEDLERYPSGR